MCTDMGMCVHAQFVNLTVQDESDARRYAISFTVHNECIHVLMHEDLQLTDCNSSGIMVYIGLNGFSVA